MSNIDLTTPIELLRPPRVVFGAGKAAEAGRWVRERGFTRVLVVADAFNAARVELLGLGGGVTIFADIKPEPDVPNLEALLAVAEQAHAA